ncbi:chalcone isomerase family protein [Neptunomonas marina]|uniref:Chalcone isomerase domain-containing protein n=1 Tax=Neptunomonas marina TaxID=1815562 RepID=A0A437Q4N5_9GAMM|nr:chalcone isomerase family protein [Neptunomonas marina]RVU29464.1 hypothetical protein EOE65_16100 [Neptunomonas marina]
MFRITTRWLLSISLMFAFAVPLQAAQLTQPSFKESWQDVGEAHLKVFWFDVYNAVLRTPTGRFDGYDAPLQLCLDYQRKIRKKMLLDETRKHLNPLATQAKVERWMLELQQMWPSVKEGDQIAFQIDEQGKGHFFFNQTWIGTMKDPEFSPAFVKIWLGRSSMFPELAEKLRGGQ